VLVRLVTRLVVAQAIAAAAVGLLFSRRHLPSVLITLAMVAALCVLALLVRSGTRVAWLAAVPFEVAYIGYGLSRFFVARYVGGTLFAIFVAAALAHPAVARAYAIGPRRPREDPRDGLALGDSAGDACGGQILG
jgi:ribose/xylose/arabinose/galactoside ABC-type transport system permease subunit